MTHPAPAYKSFADRTSLYQEITDKIIAELEQLRRAALSPPSTARRAVDERALANLC